MKKNYKSLHLRLSKLILPAAVLLSLTALAQAPATPAVITSGFNQDIIANGIGNASASTTMSFDQVNTRALVSQDFQATAGSTAPVYALPANGTIVSNADSNVTFQLGNYGANNALYLTPGYVGSGTSTGTLQFSATNVKNIHFLTAAASGGAGALICNITVNFSDATTQILSAIAVPDWYNGSNYAIQGIGRVNTANNNLEGAANNPRLYQVTAELDAANYSKTITGIDFSFPGDATAEYAGEIRMSVLAISTQAPPVSQTGLTVTTAGNVPATITANNGTLQLAASIAPAGALQTVIWSVTAGGAYATVSAGGLVSAMANGTVTVTATSATNSAISNTITIVITGQLPDPVLSPVTITAGFNHDIIANGIGNASASSDIGFDETNSRALVSADFQATASAAFPTYALPANGVINSLVTAGLSFQLANYTGNNALFLTPGYVGTGTSTGSLTFSAQNVSTLYMLAGTAGGGVQYLPVVATINFSDNTTQVATVSVSDWYNGTGYAIQGMGRINRANNNLEGDATNPKLYEYAIAIDAANQTKTITGVSFSFAGQQSAEYGSEIRLSILGLTKLATVIPEVTVSVAAGAEPVITTDGGTLQLQAAVTPASSAVTWTITSGSQYATISAAGLVTATDNGTVTVRAALTSDATVYDEITITITNQIIDVTAITVTTLNNVAPSITTNGGTLQLVATVAPANATTTGVTWSVTSGSQYAMVDAAGLVTAVDNGTVTIRATAQDGTVYGEITLTIANQFVAVTTITVTTLNDVAAAITTDGGTLQLVATIAPANATNPAVIWSITSGSEYATINGSGLVTATANGTVTVWAIAQDGTVHGEITITITNQFVAVTAITVTTLNNASTTITTAGGTLQLVATATPADATETAVTWSITSGGAYAIVDANGLVTAVANGVVVVRATAEDGTVYGEIEVTVNIALGTQNFKANAVTLYPNPAADVVNIKADEIVKDVKVFNLMGQQVYTGKSPVIDIASLSGGSYIVKITFENGTNVTKKIIKL